MAISYFRSDDDDRVDGRELVERDEPGSDDLLLRGLLLALVKREHERDKRAAASE
jgi:hypothetical protein